MARASTARWKIFARDSGSGFGGKRGCARLVKRVGVGEKGVAKDSGHGSEDWA